MGHCVDSSGDGRVGGWGVGGEFRPGCRSHKGEDGWICDGCSDRTGRKYNMHKCSTVWSCGVFQFSYADSFV